MQKIWYNKSLFNYKSCLLLTHCKVRLVDGAQPTNIPVRTAAPPVKLSTWCIVRWKPYQLGGDTSCTLYPVDYILYNV